MDPRYGSTRDILYTITEFVQGIPPQRLRRLNQRKWETWEGSPSRSWTTTYTQHLFMPISQPATTLLMSNLSKGLWPAMIPPFCHQGYSMASIHPRVQGKKNQILRHKCAQCKRSYNLAPQARRSSRQLGPNLHRQQNKQSTCPH